MQCALLHHHHLILTCIINAKRLDDELSETAGGRCADWPRVPAMCTARQKRSTVATRTPCQLLKKRRRSTDTHPGQGTYQGVRTVLVPFADIGIPPTRLSAGAIIVMRKRPRDLGHGLRSSGLFRLYWVITSTGRG